MECESKYINKNKRQMRWAGHVACTRDRKGTYRILVGERPLGRPKHRWEDNIKIDI
jgi:hypothetical protein